MKHQTKPSTIAITGASRGLGRALAHQLARDGWNLILTGRNQSPLDQIQTELAPLTEVRTVVGDVSDHHHRRELARVVSTFGSLQGLINNAGLLGPSPQPHLIDYPTEILERVYQVNVIAPLALVQTLHPYLEEGSVVVNISSDAAVEAYPGWGGYGSSKAALEQLSAVLAVENPQWRVYHVDPGDMRTDMHQAAFPGEDISDRPLPEASVPGLVTLIEGDLPSGRYRAREVSPPVSTS